MNYYHYKADNALSEPKDFWKVFGSLFHSKCGQANDIVLEENNEYICDKQHIAEIFNEYFVNIAREIPSPDANFYCSHFSNHPSIMNIHKFMSNFDYSEFNFEYVIPSVISDTVLSLPSLKAMGCDNIPLWLIKDGISIIAKPLSYIFNYSLYLNTYPNSWKYGQVTPVFNRGVEYSETNYRPITILVAFNNIFEPILALQLNTYFTDKLSQFLSAYRKHYSCETTLLRIIEDFRFALNNHEFASIIGIDLSKAFDSIPHVMTFCYLNSRVIDSLMGAAHLSAVIYLMGIRESKLVTVSLLGG